MKKSIITAVSSICVISLSFAQSTKSLSVSAAAKISLQKKYPTAKKVSWEKENGKFEANWGGSVFNNL